MNKPIYTLYKLPKGFIATSDEEIEEGDLYWFNVGYASGLKNAKESDINQIHLEFEPKKVIAQQEQIDFSNLSEDDCKEIRWFDWISNWEIINNRLQNVGGVNPYAYQKGFQKAQELLSDKMFTLEEVENAYKFGVASAQETHLPFDDYKQSLQTKSWEIEGYFENNKFVITCLKK